MYFFFFSSRRRHTRWTGDWSSDVCSSDLTHATAHQPLQQGFAFARGSTCPSNCCLFGMCLLRIFGKPCLIAQILLPTDVGWVGSLLNGDPFLHGLTDDSRTAVARLALEGIGGTTPVDKRSRIRR